MGFVLAGVCFAAALACSAGGWRALLPRGMSLVDACARFGCGSLANTFLPVRGGDVVRLSLFGRVVPGGMIAVAGAVAAFSIARWLMLVPLGIGAAGSSLPPETFAAPAVAIGVAVFVMRRASGRPPRSAYALTIAFAAAGLGARVAGVTLVGWSLGVSSPLGAAMLIVPALDLIGIVPAVTPANIGVAEGTAGMALHLHGLPMGHALGVALILHVVETVASVVFGAAGAALLLTRANAVKRLLQGGFARRNLVRFALEGEQ